MKILCRLAQASAASCPAILQVGLPCIDLIATITFAMPDMEALFFASIICYRQHTKPFSDPLFQRRFSPAATASDPAGNQFPLRSFNFFTTITSAKPKRISVFCLISGFPFDKQLTEPITGQVFDAIIRRRLTSTAINHARLQTAAFHQYLISAVAPATPYNRITDPLVCLLQYGQFSKMSACQVFSFQRTTFFSYCHFLRLQRVLNLLILTFPVFPQPPVKRCFG